MRNRREARTLVAVHTHTHTHTHTGSLKAYLLWNKIIGYIKGTCVLYVFQIMKYV